MRWGGRAAGLTWLSLCAALAAGAAVAQLSGYGAVARVNGVEISSERLEGGVQELLRERRLDVARIQNPDRLRALKREVLDTLIDQELAWQAARKAGVSVSDKELDAALAEVVGSFKSEEAFRERIHLEGFTEESYRERMARLLAGRSYLEQSAAQSAKVSDEDIRAYYKENPAQFSRPEMVRARHILVSVPQDATPEQRRAARTKIEGVLKQARAGKDFAELAQEFSDDATRQWGGELDPFARGQTVKEFESAAFSLKPGQISGVVVTPSGFHLIKVEARMPAVKITLEQAKPRIRAYLEASRREQALRQELELLRSDARIEILVPL